jgi:hypothetical protein
MFACPGDGHHPFAQVWERASQVAVDAIRATGDRTSVSAAGYLWSGASSFAQQHPRAWIRDPLGAVRYEAHHYFDRDHSGTYVHTYAEEVADAAAGGFSARRRVPAATSRRPASATSRR